MLETLARRREKLLGYGLHMQPVIIVVGSLSSSEASYVVVDQTTWKISTPLKAVDICFKAFHVLHALYPSETVVWLLIQQLVYEIKTKWDARCAAVAAAITDLSI